MIQVCWTELGISYIAGGGGGAAAGGGGGVGGMPEPYFSEFLPLKIKVVIAVPGPGIIQVTVGPGGIEVVDHLLNSNTVTTDIEVIHRILDPWC